MTEPAKKDGKSPNTAIDKAIKKLMKEAEKEGEDGMPPETKVKVINSAIAWEKVKHNIKDDEEFDPNAL